MKKRRVVLSLLLGASMLLSACGGNGGSGQTADTSSSAGKADNAADQAGTSASQEDSAKAEGDIAADVPGKC